MITTTQIELYKRLLKDRFEMMPRAQANASDQAKDSNGGCTDMLLLHYRFIGIAEFLVNSDIASFRENLSKSAQLQLSLFQRFDAGKPIDFSLVTMVACNRLFDALAAGNFSLATDLAKIMGGRSKAEKENDIPFNRAMGYALKEAVLANGDPARKELNRLFAGPDEKKEPEEDRDEGLTYKDFRGYGVVLDGIAARNERVVDVGLAMIIDGHIRQSKTGIFRNDDDQFLCVWGVGLANLAKSRGIPVNFNHELIPQALMI